MSEMQTADFHNKGRYYITKTCYVTKNNRELINNDKSIRVTGLKWKLLNYLMERQDKLVSYEDICAELWPNEIRDHNDITQIIIASDMTALVLWAWMAKNWKMFYNPFRERV